RRGDRRPRRHELPGVVGGPEHRALTGCDLFQDDPRGKARPSLIGPSALSGLTGFEPTISSSRRSPECLARRSFPAPTREGVRGCSQLFAHERAFPRTDAQVCTSLSSTPHKVRRRSDRCFPGSPARSEGYGHSDTTKPPDEVTPCRSATAASSTST